MQTVLNVLLTILKWIGLILLWILRIVFGLIAFVILLVILVLSIPLRFHIKGHYRADDIQAEGMISCFFRLIQARFFFQDHQFAYSVKVFGKTLMESKPKEELKKEENEEIQKETSDTAEKSEPEKESGKNDTADTSEKLPSLTENTSKEAEERKGEMDVSENKESSSLQKNSDPTAEAKEKESSSEEDLKEKKKKAKEARKQEKLSRKEAKKKSKIEKAEPEEENGIPKWAEEVMQPIGPGKLEAIWEKIGALLAKIDSYYALVRFYPDKHGLVRALKRLFVHLGKAFHFKPSELSLVYGMDDPAMLAQIMGAVYALMAASKWKKLNLAVQPAFCENRMEAEGDLNFTLVLRTLVGAILGIVINISVWKLVIYLIKLRKKGKKQNGSK